ncbi:sugar phosphate isomerase/epimerase family protein [Novosphingobium sp. M1R2S20]|uniref:Sugar phosphate isomerase/epimerase family protein n=1 Tax=Novosphingobium rhizovicinum TaxID=3228928 RepID=A0ABV3REB9_9SPHN
MNPPHLSLDSLTLTDTEPMEMLKAAAGAGFDTVSLWVQAPPLFPSALLSADKEQECARVLEDTGLNVVTLEVFDLHSLEAIDSYRDALERGVRLGAKTALTINYSNPDAGAAADLLARFAEVAGEVGLGVNLEPVAGGHTTTLSQAERLIVASGADVGITFDPWHVIGGGGSIDDLSAIDLSRIRYVQLCDGPIPMPEEQVGMGAVCERTYPGEGQFPLLGMLNLLPKDVPYGVECPSVSRAQAGRSALEQAREVRAAALRVLQALG